MVETANLLEIIVLSTAKGERYQDNTESECITPIAPALLPNKTRRNEKQKQKQKYWGEEGTTIAIRLMSKID